VNVVCLFLEERTVRIFVEKARVFVKPDLVGKKDPYVRLLYAGRAITKNETQSPEWEEGFFFDNVCVCAGCAMK
jgi:hypothetical protein